MKATVDRDTCIGCELCASICPEVFEMDEDSIAIVIEDPVLEDHQDDAEEARDSCPVDAIDIEEE